VAETLFNYLRDVLYNASHAKLNIENLPEDFRPLGEGLVYFSECVLETRNLAKALSKGDLNNALPSPDNEMAAPLKALHSSLKHLTWQTQQVAKGDYKQRVGFMGDFAKAFNTMIEQLDQRQKALMAEIESGQRKTQALAQSNSLFEAITGQISQWIVVVAKETGEWLYINRPVESSLITKNLEPDLRNWLTHYAYNLPDNSSPRIAELELERGDISQFFSAAIYALHWYEHQAVAFVLTDVSVDKERIRALENVAYKDTLTQIFNRHYGMQLLSEWLAQGKTFIICFVDMDNLKYVNDKYGHAEGDKYILCVTGVLRKFSPDAVICRLGGDEFMLLAQNWTLSNAQNKLEALRDMLIQYNNGPDALYNHSMSYGVIEVNADNTHSESELLSIADEKMYEYKRSHKMERQGSVH
jgi:diguanylate cyclase (GGDEF)-like protein